jgi:hypothetical protein
MPPTFPYSMNEYGLPEEELLFTPIQQAEPAAAYGGEILFSPVGSTYDTLGLSQEPQGTFATPTFDTDFNDDPLMGVLKDQIRQSEEMNLKYSSQLDEISDRSKNLTNSAEQDWSTLGASLFGALGAGLAGGNAGQIAGSAADVGTTHYNNLEAQEKTKIALSEREYGATLQEQRLETQRTQALRNALAQTASKLSVAQAKGDVIGTQENNAKQEQKVELKAAGASKPLNEAYAKSVDLQEQKSVDEFVNKLPPNMKPFPPERGGASASAYANKKETGTPMTKVEGGYLLYLDGIDKVIHSKRNGSQWNDQDKLVYEEGQRNMAEGRKQMAEVGQAITDSEWTRNIAPYLSQELRDFASPTFSWGRAVDDIVRKKDGMAQLEKFKDGMEQARAKHYLTKKVILPNFDYNRLSPYALNGLDPQELTNWSRDGLTFEQAKELWFADSLAYKNKIPSSAEVTADAPKVAGPTPTPTAVTASSGRTPEQEARFQKIKAEEMAKLKAGK